MLLPTALPSNSKQKRIIETLLEEVQSRYSESSDQVSVNRLLLFAVETARRMEKELAGIFTRGELSLIIDAENGTLISPQYWGSKRMIAAHIEDAQTYNDLQSKWGPGVTVKNIVAKIEAMPASLLLFLHEEIYRFWNEGENSLEKFLEKYAA